MSHNPQDIRLIKYDLQAIKFYLCHPLLKCPQMWLILMQQPVMSHRIWTLFQRQSLRGQPSGKLSFLKLLPSGFEGLSLSFLPSSLQPSAPLFLIAHGPSILGAWLLYLQLSNYLYKRGMERCVFSPSDFQFLCYKHSLFQWDSILYLSKNTIHIVHCDK